MTRIYRTFDNRILAIRDGKYAYWVTGDDNSDELQLWIMLMESKRI